MLTRSLALALSICGIASTAPKRKVPMIRATLEASVTFGPGREPPPGTPPFQPKLEGTLTFAEPPPKDLKFHLWLVPTASAPTKAPSAVKGAKALPHEVLDSDGNLLSCRANWPQGFKAEEWRAAVEFSVGGRSRGHAQATVKALYLPSAPPRGGRDQPS